LHRETKGRTKREERKKKTEGCREHRINPQETKKKKGGGGGKETEISTNKPTERVYEKRPVESA